MMSCAMQQNYPSIQLQTTRRRNTTAVWSRSERFTSQQKRIGGTTTAILRDIQNY